MNKKLLGVALVVVLLAAGLVLVSSGSAKESTTLTVVERATTDVVTDTGDEGDSAGDILTFANEVYDADNANLAGTDNGYCVRTVVGAAWECFWTVSLDGGQVTVEGPFLDAGDSVLAITGGTGAYLGARGQMMLHARNAEGSEYDFTYEFSD